jgi:hypothetical protein
VKNTVQPGSRTRPDDREYMTSAEFAALPSGAHHAVWAAHAARRVDAVPATSPSGPLRYRRDQVQAILRQLAVAQPEPREQPGEAP